MSQQESIVANMVEVSLVKPEDFLKVRETLTRIGVASKKDSTLYQSCHILHKRGRYYIVHFKELFALDGKPTNISDEDVARRNRIATLLEEWGLLKILNPEKCSEVAPMSMIKVIPYRDKSDWSLMPKYTIGKKRTESSVVSSVIQGADDDD